jgi:DDE superfamily endonuclease
MRRAAVGIPDTLRFREKWRIALAHVRTVLKAGFTITGVVVDADYGSNAAFRDGLERLGLRYAVAIRGEATFAPTGAGLTATAAVIADAAAPDDWHTVTWGTGTTGALTASFAGARVRAPKGRGEDGCCASDRPTTSGTPTCSTSPRRPPSRRSIVFVETLRYEGDTVVLTVLLFRTSDFPVFSAFAEFS